MKKNLQKITSYITAIVIAGAISSALAVSELIPLGKPIGIKIYSDGVIVAGISDVQTDVKKYSPASEAGIKTGDIIIKINGNKVRTTEQLEQILKDSQGNDMTLEVMRKGEPKTLYVKPARSTEDGIWHIGAWVRDSMAGIGTISFVDPKTGKYGALGHAVCDIDSGQLIPLYSGSVMQAEIIDVKRGLPGTPGELHGAFDLSEDIGTIEKNTASGIFGKLMNNKIYSEQKSYPVGSRNSVYEGKATIISTVDGSEPKEYEIEIVKIYHDRTAKEKNMLIKITDKLLLEKTGGIVQGMSGSPIIQDGKLIGAVTHVLVNDSQKGYGIFIDNMIDVSEKNSNNKKAA